MPNDFYHAYEDALNTPTDRVGVWVSGYFGSGKSHFLKMLSYLLENPEVDGRHALGYFEDKIKDQTVMVRMRRAAAVTTESMLFNVDAKGGGWKEGETARTALLRTFARVFYDHRGFYGTDLMLNLQTLVERLGTECRGDVWVGVTSQEALDEMHEIVNFEFSKIQGRFATRLSLSSTSVDEVIQKRVLWKTEAAATQLRATYVQKSAVLRNLFVFEDSVGDLEGYNGENDFVSTYPFLDYQFTLMPHVLEGIRKHGYSGKHLSTGERSMLSTFKESAQAVERQETGALVPFWRLFDTLEKQLDHGIRQIFERARQAVERVAIRDRCDATLARYSGSRQYPGRDVTTAVRRKAEALLQGSRDPESFLRAFTRKGDDLADDLVDLAQVEGFFAQQRPIFDAAWDAERRLFAERAYFEADAATTGGRQEDARHTLRPCPVRTRARTHAAAKGRHACLCQGCGSQTRLHSRTARCRCG